MNIVRFPKKTEYALLMMAELAKANGKLVSVQILKTMDIPRSYLVRIAKDLIKANLIVAKEGRTGGYLLGKDASKITFKDIAEAVAVAGCTNEKFFSPYMKEVAKVLHKHKLSELGDNYESY